MKQQDKQREDQVGADNSVMSGGFRGVLGKQRRTKLIVVAAAVLVILIGIWGYQVMRSLNPSVTEGVGFDASRISGDYQTMTDPEIRYLLKKNTGLDADTIRHRAVSRNEVGDFKRTYEVAKAMAGLEERQRAYEAYVIAESMLDSGDFDYATAFYDDFARICLEKGDSGEVKRVATKAKALIDQSNLSSVEKSNEKNKFEDLIWLSER